MAHNLIKKGGTAFGKVMQTTSLKEVIGNATEKVGSAVKEGSSKVRQYSTCQGGKLIDTIQGKEYKWCNCGNSSQQPLCDNYSCYLFKDGFNDLPKMGVAFTETGGPKKYCLCKNTSNPPYCDAKGMKDLKEGEHVHKTHP